MSCLNRLEDELRGNHTPVPSTTTPSSSNVTGGGSGGGEGGKSRLETTSIGEADVLPKVVLNPGVAKQELDNDEAAKYVTIFLLHDYHDGLTGT